MKWFLVIHILSFVCWYAGLFYLPRLFVYHAMTKDSSMDKQFKVMERRLFFYIMTPAMIITLMSGFALMGMYLNQHPQDDYWLRAKLLLVLFLLLYHVMCGYYLAMFKSGDNIRGDKFFRIFNEVPSVLLVLIVILTIVKPF